MDNHLQNDELDLLRRGEGTREAKEHLSQCDQCTDEMNMIEQISDAIGESSPAMIAVPPERDRVILELGKAAIRQQVIRKAQWTRLWLGATAAAVLLVVGLGIWSPLFSTKTPTSVIAGDMDGDGQVDIVDAYQMRLALRQQKSMDGRWDLTGDGQVTMADVEWIITESVSLTKESR